MSILGWNPWTDGRSRAIVRWAILIAAGAIAIAGEPLPGLSVEIPPFTGQVILNDVPVEAADNLGLDAAELDDDELDLHWNGLVGKKNHEITISGRAFNEKGEPIAGARIFVIPVAEMGMPFDRRTRLAETKTDAEGQYCCERVSLTVLEFAQTAVPKPAEGLFQVFGIAEGYGYTWRRIGAYRPVPRPDDDDTSPSPPAKKDLTAPFEAPILLEEQDEDDGMDLDAKTVFFADSPIAIDLAFQPEVKLHGTIRDDLGNPLKDALVQVGLVGSNRSQPDASPSGWNGNYLEGTAHSADGSFSGYFALPEEFRQAKTDEHGRYEIRGIPRDCSLLAHLDYRPEFDPWTGTIVTGISTEARQSPRLQNVGHEGAFDYVFVAPVTVHVKVVGPMGQAVANVVVRHEAKSGVCRAGGLDRTDANGLATLKLRPGKTRILAEPAIGVGFLPGQETMSFSKTPREYQIEMTLAPAAEVIFEAIEKKTGKPIADIRFLSEPSEVRERKSVQSQISFVDHPRTDHNGQLRAFFAPGERKFFVRPSSTVYEPIAPASEPIKLSSDQPTHVRFEFSRRPIVPQTPDVQQQVPDELKPLAELLRQQAEQIEQSRRARFRVCQTNYLPQKNRLSQQRLTELLESFASKPLDECLESLGFKPMAFVVLTTDGLRRRVDSEHTYSDLPHVSAFNGEEVLISMGNQQLDIFAEGKSFIHFLDPRDFWHLPNDKVLFGTAKSKVAQSTRTLRQRNGAWDVELTNNKQRQRFIIDESTGFLLRSVVACSENSGNEIWQFFPIKLATGACVPGLTVTFQYQQGKIDHQEVFLIQDVKILEQLSADAFVVSAPSGTNIIDYRGFTREEMQTHSRRPESGVVSSDIPDVVAYRNRFAPAAPPVLRVGDIAPRLNVAAWLDLNGETEQPRFEGKVVVIDFWGIGCGPCVAGLPKVNQAAKHFADSSIVIVGVHDCGNDAAEVNAFVNKRGLVFPIAIDQPNHETQSFGATFSAFGIDAMPSSVVIDQKGKVAFIGEFENALEVANRLVQGQ